MNSGQLHLGNFNTSSPLNSTIEHPSDSSLRLSLEVQGKGFIKQLEHGLPRRGIATTEGINKLEVVEDTPFLLSSRGHKIEISNLHISTTDQQSSLISGVYYSVTISGAGVGGECSAPHEYTVFSAKYIATPLFLAGRHRLHVKALVPPGEKSDIGEGVIKHSVDSGLGTLTIYLKDCTIQRDIVVDIKRAGRSTASPMVNLF